LINVKLFVAEHRLFVHGGDAVDYVNVNANANVNVYVHVHVHVDVYDILIVRVTLLTS
jgi:hypothetical protein